MAHAFVARIVAGEAQASRRGDLSAVAEATLSLSGHTARLCAATAAFASGPLCAGPHHERAVECAAREGHQVAGARLLRLCARLIRSALGEATSEYIL